ncbi:condensation domain-containing protein [Microtetraspora niveoalba]|uniref:condensation domain-containing protein n=1 Tax=Microtetraspora niveoalba TaxID=46175 RepID=UPI00082B1129|nr:condensation domain-containing protein [Microtetraspora niveoalba]
MSTTAPQASYAQVGMWITERMGRAGSAYRMPLLVTFDGLLDVPRLVRACEELIGRHPVLSTAVDERDGVPVEVPAAPPSVEVTLAGDVDDLVRAEIRRPFDVRTGPLARFRIARIGPARHALIIVAHHLVFDGESKDVLVRDLAALYNGSPVTPLQGTYADHAAADRERVAELIDDARDFWRTRWREPGDVALPGLTSSPDGPGRSRGAEDGAILTFRAELPDGSGARDVSRFELFLASVHALLFAYGNAEPVCAVDMSTRTHETRDHIGLYVNELPVASTPTPSMTVAELAARLRADLRELYRFRPVPLARAVRGLRPRTAMAPVSVSYRRRRPAPEFAGLRTTVDWAVFNGSVRSVLHIQAIDGPDGLDVITQYSPRALSGGTQIVKDLKQIMKNPDSMLGDILTGDSRTEPSGLADEIRAIWQEVLGIDEIGDDEDLFDLGGHSLTITQIIARMQKRLGIEVSLDVFFDTPTIAGVVESVARSGSASGSGTPGSGASGSGTPGSGTPGNVAVASGSGAALVGAGPDPAFGDGGR